MLFQSLPLRASIPLAARPVPPLVREIPRIVALAFLLPLLPSLLWRLQMHSSLNFRGWINAEYILLLCAALLVPSVWMIGLLTLELIIALLEPAAHLYYFSPSDAVLSLQYLSLIPAPRLAGYAGLLLVYVGVSAVSLRLLIGDRRRPNAAWAVGALILSVTVAVSFDVATGRHNYFLRSHAIYGDTDMRRGQAVRTPVLSILDGMAQDLLHPANGPTRPLPSELRKAVTGLNTGAQPDIVLVLVESWGLATNPAALEIQTRPYRTPAIEDRYHVESGATSFFGGTTSGETRELCGDSHGRPDLGLPSGYFAGCLPARLKAAGYRTLAVHGFTPTMYHRMEWYKRFGFDESAFLPELERDGTSLCDGAFPGACDADVANWIGRKLVHSHDRKPMFLHWVTLNSHLPVAPVRGERPSGQCRQLAIDQESSLCAWFDRVVIVHNSVATLATEPALRPTIFVIVGDHAPPFLKSSLRDRFSQTEVPYVLLMPKCMPPASNSIAQSPAASATQQHP